MRDGTSNWKTEAFDPWAIPLPGRVIYVRRTGPDEVEALVSVKRRWWQLWRPRHDARCKVRARMDGTIIGRS
jgi:hypothetical protein